MSQTTNLIIAIDGASGSGKSSTAKEIAKKYELAYLDTGAMYRIATYIFLQKNFSSIYDFLNYLNKIITSGKLKINLDPEKPTIILDNQDINNIIRGNKITKKVSEISAMPEIRAMLIAWQQSIIAQQSFENSYSGGRGIVAEGRDITTVVAPNADVKILLQSSESARANRRAKELGNKNVQIVEKDIKQRDKADLKINNFSKAQEGTITVDNTDMTLAETTEFISKIIKQKLQNSITKPTTNPGK
jgi:GTP-binding protein